MLLEIESKNILGPEDRQHDNVHYFKFIKKMKFIVRNLENYRWAFNETTTDWWYTAC